MQPDLRHPAFIQATKRLEQLHVDQFELYLERTNHTTIESKEHKIDSLSRAEDVGLAIRLLKGRKLGFSFTTALDRGSVDRAVQTAFEVAELMPEDEFAGLHSFGAATYPTVDNHDSVGQAVPISQKASLALELESACRKADKRITGIRSASLGETLYQVRMLDSSGRQIHHQSTLYTASVTCKAEQGGDSQIGGDFGFSSYLDQLDIKTISKTAVEYAVELLGATPPPTMQCPAVLRNTTVAELIDFLAASFSAEQIDKGRSMLAGKRGTKVFGDEVSIIDDGLLPGGYATSPFDGEGTPCRKTVLVDQGTFSNALYDTYYARKLNAQPTGSATRGIKSPPTIGTSNLFLMPGKKEPRQLLDGISRGILITDLMGVHTANPVTGDFSLGASGILIENGNLTRPVRGFAVAGNVMEVFCQIADISNDLKFIGGVGAPSIRIREISIGGA